MKIKLDIDKIVECVELGLSCPQIAKQMNTYPSRIMNAIKVHSSALFVKVSQNGINRQHNSMTGKTNPKWRANKGKTYEEIYGGIEKAQEMRMKRSEWMKINNIAPTGDTYEEKFGAEMAEYLKKKRSNWLKDNNIRKFATRISKPQAVLFSIVKQYFTQAELEFEIKVAPRKSIWLDIAIPDLKINIEYDGIYWHKFNKTTIRTSDDDRDLFLKEQGWRVFRIQSAKNLTETELRIEFDKLDLI